MFFQKPPYAIINLFFVQNLFKEIPYISLYTAIMTQIEIFQSSGFTVECLVVHGEPWFKGVDVATSLGYLRPRDAVYDHVPLEFKKTRTLLSSASSVGKTPTLDPNDGKVIFISGLEVEMLQPSWAMPTRYKH